MVRFLLALAIAIGMSGCAGGYLHDRLAGSQALAEEDDAYCKSLGLHVGDPNYPACRMALTQNRESRDEAARQRMFSMGMQMMQQ